MALRRLEDRIETDDGGNEIITRRYGLWGTTAEVEKCGRKIEVVQKNGTRDRFDSLAAAEAALKLLI